MYELLVKFDKIPIKTNVTEVLDPILIKFGEVPIKTIDTEILDFKLRSYV